MVQENDAEVMKAVELKPVRIIAWQNSTDRDYLDKAENDIGELILQGYHIGHGSGAGALCWVAMVRYPDSLSAFRAYPDADQMAVIQAEQGYKDFTVGSALHSDQEGFADVVKSMAPPGKPGTIGKKHTR